MWGAPPSDPHYRHRFSAQPSRPDDTNIAATYMSSRQKGQKSKSASQISKCSAPCASQDSCSARRKGRPGAAAGEPLLAGLRFATRSGGCSCKSGSKEARREVHRKNVLDRAFAVAAERRPWRCGGSCCSWTEPAMALQRKLPLCGEAGADQSLNNLVAGRSSLAAMLSMAARTSSDSSVLRQQSRPSSCFDVRLSAVAHVPLRVPRSPTCGCRLNRHI
jgi:hypothetical protein